jgi:hypothetical protein
MDRSLLVSDQDLPERGTLKLIEERKNGPTRVIENNFHPFLF